MMPLSVQLLLTCACCRSTGRSFFFIATAAWVVLSLQTLVQGYQRARYRPKSEFKIIPTHHQHGCGLSVGGKASTGQQANYWSRIWTPNSHMHPASKQALLGFCLDR
jgi:hypothetical protein